MNAGAPLPTNLRQAIQYFSDLDVATEYVIGLRWGPDGPACPRCGGDQYSYLSTRQLWKCKACTYQYSAKVGTVLQDSAVDFTKWLPLIWVVANDYTTSTRVLATWLGMTQKTVWHMLVRIRQWAENDASPAETGPTRASAIELAKGKPIG